MSKGNNRDAWIDSVMQLIPYVGPSLSALYFGHKQEKRFKRLETFYESLRKTVEQLQTKIPSIDVHDQDSLASILEKIHDEVEAEHLEFKRQCYKNYYVNTLLNPVSRDNYDVRLMYLHILKSLTETQLWLLAFIRNQNEPVIDKQISVKGMSQSVVQGSIAQLKILGLLDSQLHGFVFRGTNNAMNESIQISSLGKEFHQFCMK